MKKFLLIVVCVVVALAGCKKNENGKADAEQSTPKIAAGERLPIAVVNIDSVLEKYQKAVDANEALMKRQEDARLELSQKARALNNDMVDFQNKMENNAFLNRQRAESEYARLQQRQADLQQLEQTKTQEIVDEQQKVSQEVRDSINSVIRDINADGRYHLVVSTSSINDNVLYASPEYDITDEVVTMLNDRYNKK